MSDKSKAFWLGIFLLVGIVLVGWLVLFLKPSFGDGKVKILVRFANIDKIEKGTRVTFAGRPVGEVVKISEVPNPRESVHDALGNLYLYELTLKVDSVVHIYTYDEILFATAGLLGEKSIAIIPKATPPGSPPAQEITHTLLFGASTDRMEKALQQVSQIADTFQQTLEKTNRFLDENLGDCHGLCSSMTSAAASLDVFMRNAVEAHFIDRFTCAADAVCTTMYDIDRVTKEIQDYQLVKQLSNSVQDIHTLTQEVIKGEGTLGRLIHSDGLYLQLSGLLYRVDTFFRDLNQYGILFQYDKSWQRARTARRNQMEALSTPCGLYDYVDRELGELSVSLDRIGCAIERLEGTPLSAQDFITSFRELMGRVEALQNSLKLYTELLTESHDSRCNEKR